MPNTEESRWVEFNEQMGATPFIIHIGGAETALSIDQFKQFYQDCEEAMQAYEAEKIADELYRKAQAEVAGKKLPNFSK